MTLRPDRRRNALLNFPDLGLGPKSKLVEPYARWLTERVSLATRAQQWLQLPTPNRYEYAPALAVCPVPAPPGGGPCESGH